VDRAKHQLLRSDANAVSVPQLHGPGNGPAVDRQSIAGAHVLDRHVAGLNPKARMLSGNERIFDRDVARGATTDDGVARGEIDLLQ
jgi:hypothetical protein